MTIQQTIHKLSRIETLFVLDALFLQVAGIYLLSSPETAAQYFPNQAWAVPGALQLFGGCLLFASMMSAVLAYAGESTAALIGLGAFTGYHVLLALALTLQPLLWGPVRIGNSTMALGNCVIEKTFTCKPIFENGGLGLRHPWIGPVFWLIALVFVYAFGSALLRKVGRSAKSPRNLRSQWEMSIREAAGQEERNRLARDLHDSIKQQIFAIQTSVAAAQVRIANGGEGAQAALEDARQSAREAISEMETMLDQLQAAPLENQGLAAAIGKQCEALGFRTGAKVSLHVGDLPASESLPPGVHQVVYRIVQESLSNIARHARATEVEVRLGADEKGDLLLSIRDNGQGFDVVNGNKGMGLRNLHSRAEEVRGIGMLQSTPGGGGTHLEIRFPVEQRQAREEGGPVQFLSIFGIAIGLMIVHYGGYSTPSWLLGAAVWSVAVASRSWLRRNRTQKKAAATV